MKRKGLLWLISLCLLMGLLSTGALAAGSDLTVTSTALSAAEGEPFTVTIKVPAIAEKLTVAELRLNFDRARFEVVSFVPPDINGATLTNSTVEAANKAGFVSASWESNDYDNTLDFSSGFSLSAEFRVKPGAAGSGSFTADPVHCDFSWFNDTTYDFDNKITVPSDAAVTVTISAAHEESYVERAYRLLLGRAGDAEGIAHWESALSGGTSAGEIIKEFFRSEEYKARGLDEAETVTLCYQAMLSREPDAAGLENWTKLLKEGYSTTKLVSEFVASPEFIALCDTYGLTAGTIALDARDQNSNITRFVLRCYAYALDREADEEGLNNWCAQLLAQETDPERVAFGFVFSNEANGRALDDEAFIAMLYRMMLDRAPDADGLANWVAALRSSTEAEIAYDAAYETDRSVEDATNQARQNIYATFAASEEFANMIKNFGF